MDPEQDEKSIAPGSLSPPCLPLPQAVSSDLTSLETEGDENSLFGRLWGGAGHGAVLQLQPQPPPCTHLSPPRDPGDRPGSADCSTSSALFSGSLARASGILPFLPAWPALQNQKDLTFRDHQGQTAIYHPPPKKKIGGSDFSGHPSKLRAEPWASDPRIIYLPWSPSQKVVQLPSPPPGPPLLKPLPCTQVTPWQSQPRSG